MQIVADKLPGVYEIRNVASGRRYVGSSKNVRRRLHEHRQELRCGKHRNPALQNAYIAHGEGAFVARVLAYLELDELVSTEQRLLDLVFAEAATYNISLGAAAGMRGRKHSAAALARMSASQKANPTRYWLGKTFSDEHRAKLSASGKGRLSAMRGKKHTAEARAKMSASQKARIASNPRKPLTDDQRAKRSEARKGRVPYNKGARSAACKRGHERTEATLYIHPKSGIRHCKVCRKLWDTNSRNLIQRGRLHGG